MDAVSDTGTRQCCKALKFQLARLLEQQSADKRAKRTNSDEHFHKIISLEDKVKSLTEKLRVVHREKMEIETNWTTGKQELESRVADLQKRNAKLLSQQTLAHDKHRAVLEDLKEAHREAFQKLTLQTHSDTSEMIASHDRRLKQTELANKKEKETLVLEHEEEIRQHVTKLQCLEKESTEALMELRNSINEKEATFQMDMKTLQSMYLKTVEENNEYQRVNKVLKDKVKPLGDLLNNLSMLKWTLVTKNNLIKTKNMELAQSKKDNSKIRHLLAEEQASYLILKIRLDCELAKNLEDKVKEAQFKVEQKENICKENGRLITNLQGQITGLKDKVASLKTSALEERKRSNELKAYQQRFKAELLACMDLISHPSEFKKSMIALKRTFVDDGDLKVPERDERFQEQFLKAANNMRQKLADGECRQVMDERRKYLKKCKEVHEAIRVINEQTVIIRTQQDQIQRMEQDRNQKGRCWKEAQRPSRVGPLAARGATGGDSAPLEGDATAAAPSCQSDPPQDASAIW